MARLRPGRLISPALGALALLLAFLQRPGDAYSDTRLELSADPGLFLSRVADVWSSTTDLGHVQSGLHSLQPGHTPYVRSQEDLEALYDWWRRVLTYCEMRGVKPASVAQIMQAVVR